MYREGSSTDTNIRRRKPAAAEAVMANTELSPMMDDVSMVTTETEQSSILGDDGSHGRQYTNGSLSRTLADLSSGEGSCETSLTRPLLAPGSSSDDEVDVDVFVTSRSTHTVLKTDDEEGERSWHIALQVFFPYMIAGLGMVAAGLVLNEVKHWSVFIEVSEIFILVPALLGLKGNLEMTLAARLSTQANLGNMDMPAEQWKMIGGNLALTQAQAIIVGLLASMFAIALGWIPEGKFNLMHGLLLCSSSVITASLASLVLGLIMIGVVILSRKCHINPDNVATPIAASLGDLTTISLLAGIAMSLYTTLDTHKWLTPSLLVFVLLLIPVWWYVSHHNRYTHEVLYTGWVPVIGAMAISSVGGLILDYTVVHYQGVAVFQPVINGVGGNLVAVQASRLSTALHKVSTPGKLPDNAVHGCPNPCSSFFGKNMSARTARVLMAMVIPGQVVFMFTIQALKSGHSVITWAFAGIYIIAAVIQVAVLLYIANFLVHFLWQRGSDPDNSAIPYLTAIGDLLGTGLLALAFVILAQIEPGVEIMLPPTATTSYNMTSTEMYWNGNTTAH